MSIPVDKRIERRLRQLVRVFKPTPFQRQRSQWPPPRLNQVESTSVLEQEPHLYLWPSQQRHLHISTSVNAQIVLNQQPKISREGPNHLH